MLTDLFVDARLFVFDFLLELLQLCCVRRGAIRLEYLNVPGGELALDISHPSIEDVLI
jgi:hypothetical protein